MDYFEGFEIPIIHRPPGLPGEQEYSFMRKYQNFHLTLEQKLYL